jgi:oligopeptide transport system ATP-binding protein
MSDPKPLIRVDDVVKHFPLNDKVFGSSGVIHAVDNVSVELYPGEVLGVVGESGCGKSTLANLIMKLEEPTSGTIEYLGRDISTFEKDELRTYRREVQMVFQDTFGSLDPRMTINDVLTEPFTIHRDVLS